MAEASYCLHKAKDLNLSNGGFDPELFTDGVIVLAVAYNESSSPVSYSANLLKR